MSSLYDVGETAYVTVWLRDDDGLPVDADSTPLATLTDPTGAVTGLTVSQPSVGQYKVTAPLPLLGDYVLRTEAVVAGATRVDVRRLAALDPASSVVALPAWAPSLADVADHIPTRTRPTVEWGGSDAAAGTFTDATTPTRDQVGRLIRAVCGWVTSQVGTPVYTAAYPAAAVAAALRAAYWVELGYPERDADLAVYDRLREEADAATVTAREVNSAAGAIIPDPMQDGDLVSYAFPTDHPVLPIIIYPWYAPAPH